MFILFSMWASLVGGGLARFSKTARPGPGHGEARRHGFDDGALTVGSGRFADDLAEGAAEGAEAVEADIEADVGHAAVGLAQQEHGALDAPALEVAVGSLAEGGVEGADEVRL